MAVQTWLRCFTDPLEERGIVYMVTGSVASMLYAEPRMTLDIDLVVELRVEDAAAFLDAFPAQRFYKPPLEVAREECARGTRGHFNLIDNETGYKADIYLAGTDPLHRWALARRRRTTSLSSPITLAPPEYVIVRKLEFWREGGSEKHIQDVSGVLAAGVPLDREFLEDQIRARGLDDAWQRVSGSSARLG
jgi:hypothetical protein